VAPGEIPTQSIRYVKRFRREGPAFHFCHGGKEGSSQIIGDNFGVLRKRVQRGKAEFELSEVEGKKDWGVLQKGGNIKPFMADVSYFISGESWKIWPQCVCGMGVEDRWITIVNRGDEGGECKQERIVQQNVQWIWGLKSGKADGMLFVTRRKGPGQQTGILGSRITLLGRSLS